MQAGRHVPPPTPLCRMAPHHAGKSSRLHPPLAGRPTRHQRHGSRRSSTHTGVLPPVGGTRAPGTQAISSSEAGIYYDGTSEQRGGLAVVAGAPGCQQGGAAGRDIFLWKKEKRGWAVVFAPLRAKQLGAWRMRATQARGLRNEAGSPGSVHAPCSIPRARRWNKARIVPEPVRCKLERSLNS
jgi:hypothetical protein